MGCVLGESNPEPGRGEVVCCVLRWGAGGRDLGHRVVKGDCVVCVGRGVSISYHWRGN